MPFCPKVPSVAFVLALGLLVGCGNSSSARSSGQAPAFELRDLSGKRVTLDSYKGKPVLLDFWATWCAPCVYSIPLVQQLYDRHKLQGFTVLGLNMDDDPTEVYAFVKRMKVTYPILYAGQTAVPSDYALKGLPLFILIDSEGNIIKRYDGFSPRVIDELDTILTRLLPTKPS